MSRISRKQRRAAAKRKKTVKKKISLADAVELAINFHQHGSLDDAEKIYRHILQARPDHPDALHYLGVISHQRGRSDAAVELIRKAVSFNPSYPGAHNNLGNVLKEMGRTEEAEAAYRACLSLDPENVDALSNLGAVLRDNKKYDEALSSLERAVAIAPNHSQAYHNMGNVLKKLNRLEEAIAAYRKSIDLLHPDDSKVHVSAVYKSLSRALFVGRKYDEAIVLLKQWLEFDPGSAIAAHMLSACSGENVPDRASDAYVSETFDTFAGSFDNVLKKLKYHAPELVVSAIHSQVGSAFKGYVILDAGCGTGLCGLLLRDYAIRMTGVDLSRAMINKAQGRDIYDDLVVAELTEFMQQHPDSYDLIASADTLCYFGNLSDVLCHASAALKENGLLVFTLEKIPEPEPGELYRLNPHGRYSHSQDYVSALIKQTGLRIARIVVDCLRYEAGEPVTGMVITAIKGKAVR